MFIVEVFDSLCSLFVTVFLSILWLIYRRGLRSVFAALGNSATDQPKKPSDSRANVTFLGLEIIHAVVSDIEDGVSTHEILQSPQAIALLDAVATEARFVRAMCATLLLKTNMKLPRHDADCSDESEYEIPRLYGPPLILVPEKCATYDNTHDASAALLFRVAVYACAIDSKRSDAFWKAAFLKDLGARVDSEDASQYPHGELYFSMPKSFFWTKVRVLTHMIILHFLGSALYNATKGVGIISFGIRRSENMRYPIEDAEAEQLPENPVTVEDKIKVSWRSTIQDPVFTSYLRSKLPSTLQEMGGFDPAEPLELDMCAGSSFLYDAVTAAGMTMCQTEQPFFMAEDVIPFIKNCSLFTGATGTVNFDESATRDFRTVIFTLWNVLPREDASRDGENSFSLIHHIRTMEGVGKILARTYSSTPMAQQSHQKFLLL